jgi:hypothetical protein
MYTLTQEEDVNSNDPDKIRKLKNLKETGGI